MASTPVTVQRVRSASRSQQVERALLDLIVGGALHKGDRLPPEQHLADQFGVSRVTVREAIARLRADGMVSTKPGRGAVVESVAPRAFRFNGDAGPSFEHLFELRRLIEIEAAALAAQRRDGSTLAAIEEAHEAMRQAAQAGSHAPEIDMAFHRAVAAATGNPQLLALVDFIAAQQQTLFAQAWVNSARHEGGAHHAQSEHETLIKAIRAGDPVKARAAATAHLDAAQLRLARYRPDTATGAAALLESSLDSGGELSKLPVNAPTSPTQSQE